MAVIGPMARSAADLSLLLDVMAGPDPLDAGVAYKLALPPPRHDALKDFRVLVIDSDPMLPTNKEVRGSIEKLAGDLGKAGVKVTRQSPLWPDFAESSRLPAGANSLAAERLRGITQSHRGWVLDEGARAWLRSRWRNVFGTFDAVICPIMPTPAYPHDHSPDQETRRIDIDGTSYPYPDQLAWPGVATLPGLPATALPLGLSSQGLPLGVQIVGPWLEDRTPLRLAELIEREFGGFIPPKMFDD
jgi:amidase